MLAAIQSNGARGLRQNSGGRSSVSNLNVTIFGCTGFIGRYLVNKFGNSGSQVVTPYRGDGYDVNTLRVMGDVGRIVPLKFHLEDYQSIRECVRHSQVVINLVGQFHRSLNFKPEQVHIDGIMKIAKACKEENVPRLIHLVPILAQLDSKSKCLRTKAIGEEMLRQEYPRSIIVKSSNVFGNEDRFLNNIGLFSFSFLGYPVINHGRQIRYPLHVDDLVEGLYRIAKLPNLEGLTFNLYGPKKYTYREIVELFAQMSMRDHPIRNMGPWSLLFYSMFFPEWRRPHHTPDLIKQMMEDEIINRNHIGFEDLGLNREELKTLEDTAIEFVRGYRHSDDFSVPPIKYNLPNKEIK